MSDKTFVDTNILVYSRDSGLPDKQAAAAAELEHLWKNRTGRISAQVCSEYYVTVTRKLNPGISEKEAWKDVEALFAWEPLPVDKKVIRKARECQKKYQLSWWDSLIVAAAHFCDCSTLLSEDLSNGQNYFNMEVRNPFL